MTSIFVLYIRLVVFGASVSWLATTATRSANTGRGRGSNSNLYNVPFQMTDEQRLLYNSLKKYDRDVRPVRNVEDAVVVNMSLTLTKIFELDEQNQVLITSCWVNFQWVDEYLQWQPEEYSNMEMVRMNSTKLWLPDILLYNSAAQYNPTRGRRLDTRAMVNYKGVVFWSTPRKLYSSCKIDVTYFPFDQQKCVMKFGSWTYDNAKIKLSNASASADLAFYEKSGEWDLISAEQQVNLIYYSCCIEPYPDVSFCVKIRRKTFYYALNVVFPCFLMSSLTLLIFQLPTKSGEKCGLGVTLMLSFAIYMLTVIKKLPETSDSFPLISIYLTAVLSMTAVSVCCTVSVLSLHYRPKRSNQLPRVLRKFLSSAETVCCVKPPPPFWQRRSYRNISVMASRQFLSELSHELAVMDSRVDDPVALHAQVFAGINRIIDRHSHDIEDHSAMVEWARLAELVDKSLFWFLLLITATFSVWILHYYAPEHQLAQDNDCQLSPKKYMP